MQKALEREAQRELNLALAGEAHVRDSAEVRIAQIKDRLSELRRVEQVEELRAELHGEAFRGPEVLEQSEIHEASRRSIEEVARRGSGARVDGIAAEGDCGHRRKRGRVEPEGVAGRAVELLTNLRIAYEVRTGAWVATLNEVDREAALKGNDGIDLPSAKDVVQSSTPVVAQRVHGQRATR